MRSEDILRREHLLLVLNTPGERVPGEAPVDGGRDVPADALLTASLHSEDKRDPFVRWAVRHKASIRRLPIVGGWAVTAYHHSASTVPAATDGLTRGERVTRLIPIVGPMLVWCVRLVLLPQRFAKLSAAFVQLEQRTRDEHVLLMNRVEQLDSSRSGSRDVRRYPSGAGHAHEFDAMDSALVAELMMMLPDLVVPDAGKDGEPRFALVGYEGEGPEWLEELLHRFHVECIGLGVSRAPRVREDVRPFESDVSHTMQGYQAGSLVGVALDVTQDIGGLPELALVVTEAFSATQTSGILMVEGMRISAVSQGSDGDGVRARAVPTVAPDEVAGLLRSTGYVYVRVVGACREGGALGRRDTDAGTRFAIVGRKP